MSATKPHLVIPHRFSHNDPLLRALDQHRRPVLRLSQTGSTSFYREGTTSEAMTVIPAYAHFRPPGALLGIERVLDYAAGCEGVWIDASRLA